MERGRAVVIWVMERGVQIPKFSGKIKFRILSRKGSHPTDPCERSSKTQFSASNETWRCPNRLNQVSKFRPKSAVRALAGKIREKKVLGIWAKVSPTDRALWEEFKNTIFNLKRLTYTPQTEASKFLLFFVALLGFLDYGARHTRLGFFDYGAREFSRSVVKNNRNM